MTIDLEEHRSGGRVEFRHPPSGAFIRFEAISPSTRGIDAWVELRLPDQDRPTRFGRFDLMGQRTVTTLTANLNSKSGPPWDEIIPEATYRLVRAELDGTPAIRLADVEASSSASYVIRPLIEDGGPTILAAGGGSAKSYLSLACAVSVATGRNVVGGLKPQITGPVLYLDWEADADEHARRLRRICAGAGIDPDGVDVHYRSEAQPLTRIAPAIARVRDELDIVFLVVDSVMLARGGDAFGPEPTIALFAALREIGRPSLLADHKSRDALDKGKRGAYGSIVGENTARRVWEITKTVDDSDRKTIRLEDTKRNNTARHDPIGFTLTWADDPEPAMTIRQIAADGIPSADPDGGSTPLYELISQVLDQSNPLGVGEICENLSSRGIPATPSTVRKVLSRYPERFTNIGSANAGRWTTTSTRPTLDNTSESEEIDVF